jgi:hypothetical protein
MIISFTGFIDTIFDDYQLSIIASYIIARLASLAREVFPDVGPTTRPFFQAETYAASLHASARSNARSYARSLDSYTPGIQVISCQSGENYHYSNADCQPM